MHLVITLEQMALAGAALRRRRGHLRVPTAVFAALNLVYAKVLARLYSRGALARRYRAASDAALALLASLREDEWEHGARCFGRRYWTVERLFANQTLHLVEHAAQIAKLLAEEEQPCP